MADGGRKAVERRARSWGENRPSRSVLERGFDCGVSVEFCLDGAEADSEIERDCTAGNARNWKLRRLRKRRWKSAAYELSQVGSIEVEAADCRGRSMTHECSPVRSLGVCLK